MDDAYYDFVGNYESRHVWVKLIDGTVLRGFIEVTFPADENDDNRISFAITTATDTLEIPLDDVVSIVERPDGV